MKLKKFKTAIDEYGNEYWIPIVAKNKDWLIGFIYGNYNAINCINNNLIDNNIDFEIAPISIPLDSSRFNCILPDGRKYSKFSEQEKLEYNNQLIEEFNNKHSNIKECVLDVMPFLSASCSCGLGYYSWKNELEIPNKNFNCSICGKLVIYYTKIDEMKIDKDVV